MWKRSETLAKTKVFELPVKSHFLHSLRSSVSHTRSYLLEGKISSIPWKMWRKKHKCHIKSMCKIFFELFSRKGWTLFWWKLFFNGLIIFIILLLYHKTENSHIMESFNISARCFLIKKNKWIWGFLWNNAWSSKLGNRFFITSGPFTLTEHQWFW